MASLVNQKYDFKGLLLLLFIALTVGIYYRETNSNPEIRFLAVLFWQFMLWMPWLFIANLVKRSRNQLKNSYLAYAICVLLVGIHVLYFVVYSTYFSPYIGAVNSKYGVYPYFFIFWSSIDLILMWVVWNQSAQAQLKSQSVLKPSKYVIKEGANHVVLLTADLIKITAEDYYIRIHSTQGEYLQRKSLKELMKQLPDNEFVRIHRSTIVNLSHIKQIITRSRKGTFVELLDGSINKVSKSQNMVLKSKLHHSLQI